jgi:hypothetical protein
MERKLYQQRCVACFAHVWMLIQSTKRKSVARSISMAAVAEVAQSDLISNYSSC